MSDDLLKTHRLFDELILLDPERREAWIDNACTGDAQLAAELRRLLRAHQRNTGILDVGFEGLSFMLGLLPEADSTSRIGDRIGPFRIVSLIGSGGMGVVYRADREDAAFSQTVALKLMRGGLRRRDSQDRFLEERRIQSKLVHSHIARLIDGGLTERGEPWFAMEHVLGKSLPLWCDEQRLGIRGRLDLWLEACDAIAFAHSRLVVHRDIKPSNVFVDEEGKIKVLDFGIARILGGESEERSEDESISLTLTPHYAAPEQLRGEFSGTAMDIYGLGVLLYELLCGRRAFGRRGLSGYAVQQQVLRDPAPPMAKQFSHPPSPEEPSVDELAARRGTDARRLRRELSGDLQQIVAKAMQKEPAWRYASVRELAADIRHYLANEPVQAAADSWGYRLRKYALRHRFGVAVVAILALSLLTVLAMSLWQRVRVQRANDYLRAQIERNNAVTDVFTSLLHSLDKGAKAVTVPELMDRAQQYALTSRNLSGEERTAIAEMVLANYTQDDTQGAASFLRSLLDKRDIGLDDESRAFFACRLAFLHFTLQQKDQAQRSLEDGKARVSSLPHGENNSRVECLITEAMLNSTGTGNEKRLTTALDLMRRAIEETDPDTALADRWNLAAVARQRYGEFLILANRPVEARASFEAALAVMKRWGRDKSIDFASTQKALALADRQRGRPLLAADEFEQAAESIRDIDPKDNTLFDIAMSAAENEMDLARLQRAQNWLNEADSVLAQLPEGKELYAALLQRIHARALALQGKLPEALAELQKSREIVMARFPKGTKTEATFRLRAIEYEMAAPSSSREPVRLLEELAALESDLRGMGDLGAELLQKTLLDSAELLSKQGDFPAAEAKAVEAKKRFDDRAGPGSWMSAACDRVIAEAEWARGEKARAQATLQDAHAGLRMALGPDHPRTREAGQRLLELAGSAR
jgi:serine/threonine-protein kinase